MGERWAAAEIHRRPLSKSAAQLVHQGFDKCDLKEDNALLGVLRS
jgi:hypothetical protein